MNNTRLDNALNDLNCFIFDDVFHLSSPNDKQREPIKLVALQLLFYISQLFVITAPLPQLVVLRVLFAIRRWNFSGGSLLKPYFG